MTILLVDDAAINTIVMSGLIEKHIGKSFVAFECPVAALAWCEDNQPELVVVDYQMPGLNGIEFVTAFQKVHGARDIPLMMLTGERDPAVRRNAVDAGVTTFLSKPIDPTDFILQIQNILTICYEPVLPIARADFLIHSEL
jgi:CheY-like chemotaxis protein